MKKQRLLLAALMISVSTWVSASVPIINLVDSPRGDVNLYSLPALNNTFFRIKDNSTLFGTSTGVHDQQSTPGSRQAGNSSTLFSRQVSAGSFSSNARQADSLQTPSAGSSGAELRYGTIVASSSMPKSWAIILLVLGCVIYQGRRRQRPFGF